MFITQNNENSAENTSLVIVQDNKAVTTSLKIAEVFEKEHRNVLRDIENILNEIGILDTRGLLKIEQSSYTNKQNKQMPMYLLNERAFTFLVMGYSGKKASQFKLNFMFAFETMKSYIEENFKTNTEISLKQKSEILPFAEIEEIWTTIKFLQEENTFFKFELEKNKQFSEGLHQRLMFMEDTLDKRPTSGLSVSDIPKTDFFVYFAFNPNNGLTKIGRSKMPESRVWIFQAVEPDLTLILLVNTASLGSSVALEQFFHKLFEKKKHNRELFLLNEYNMNVATMIKNAVELEN